MKRIGKEQAADVGKTHSLIFHFLLEEKLLIKQYELSLIIKSIIFLFTIY